ncbi:MAG: hypothetical protein J6C55_02175, partial [Oscillospiraceae bacterium]|nr:hypothetical protein [Oscillospiraceae bacterium]
MSKNIKKTAKFLTALMIINNVAPVRYAFGDDASSDALKELKDSGIFGLANANKTMNTAVAAQKVIGTEAIQKLLDKYQNGEFDGINVESISENNKNAESDIKAIEDVTVDLGAVFIVNKAKASLIDSKVKIDSESEQSVTDALKLSLSEIDNVIEAVSAIFTHDGSEKSASNSFMVSKVSKLIEGVKDSLVGKASNQVDGGADEDNSSYKKISNSVENYSKGVAIQSTAEQLTYSSRGSENNLSDELVSVVANSIANSLEEQDVSDIEDVDIDVLDETVKEITNKVIDESKNSSQEISEERVQEVLAPTLKEFDVKLSESKAVKEEKEEKKLAEELSRSKELNTSGEDILENANQLTDQQLGDLQKQISSYEKTIEDQKAELEKAKAIEASNREIEGLHFLDDESFANYEKVKKEHEEEIKAKNEEIEKLKVENKKLEELQGKSAEQQEQQRKFEEEIEAKTKEIESLQKRNKELEEIEARNKEIAELEAENKKLEAIKIKNEEQQKQQEEFEAQIEAKNKEIEDLKAKYKRQEEFEEEVKARNKEIEDLKAKNKELEELQIKSAEQQEQQKKIEEELKAKDEALKKFEEQSKKLEELEQQRRQIEIQQKQIEEQKRELEKLRSGAAPAPTTVLNITAGSFNETVDLLKTLDYSVVKMNSSGDYSVIERESEAKDDASTELKKVVDNFNSAIDTLKAAFNDLAEAMKDYQQYQGKKFDKFNPATATDEMILDYYETQGRKAERNSLKKLIETQIAYNAAVEKAVNARIDREVYSTLANLFISDKKIREVQDNIKNKQAKETVSETKFYKIMMKDPTTNGFNVEKTLADLLKDVEGDVETANKLVATAKLNKKIINAKQDKEEATLDSVTDLLENLTNFTKVEEKKAADIEKMTYENLDKYVDQMETSNDTSITYYQAQLLDENLDNRSKLEAATKYLSAKMRYEHIEAYREYNILKRKLDPWISLNLGDKTYFRYRNEYEIFKFLCEGIAKLLGQSFAGVRKLWINENDISLAKNVKKSEKEGYDKNMKEHINSLNNLIEAVRKDKVLASANILELNGKKTVLRKDAIINKDDIKVLVDRVVKLDKTITEDAVRYETLSANLINMVGKGNSVEVKLKEDDFEYITKEELTRGFIDDFLIPLLLMDASSGGRFQIRLGTDDISKTMAISFSNMVANNKCIITRMNGTFGDKLGEHIFNDEYFKQKFKSLFYEKSENILDQNWKNKIINDEGQFIESGAFMEYFAQNTFRNTMFNTKNNLAFVESAIETINKNLEISDDERKAIIDIFSFVSMDEEEKAKLVKKLSDEAYSEENYKKMKEQFGVSDVSVATTAKTGGGPPPPPPLPGAATTTNVGGPPPVAPPLPGAATT